MLHTDGEYITRRHPSASDKYQPTPQRKELLGRMFDALAVVSEENIVFVHNDEIKMGIRMTRLVVTMGITRMIAIRIMITTFYDKNDVELKRIVVLEGTWTTFCDGWLLINTL